MKRTVAAITGCCKSQRGFSLPVAIFVLVIMALLSAALVQLSSRGNIATTQEELSNRAFYAAESGASWAMSELFLNSSGPANRAFSDAVCDALDPAPAIGAAPGLATCSVSVTCRCIGAGNCSSTAAGEANLYSIESTGRCGTGQATAERTIEVGAKNVDP